MHALVLDNPQPYFGLYYIFQQLSWLTWTCWNKREQYIYSHGHWEREKRKIIEKLLAATQNRKAPQTRWICCRPANIPLSEIKKTNSPQKNSTWTTLAVCIEQSATAHIHVCWITLCMYKWKNKEEKMGRKINENKYVIEGEYKTNNTTYTLRHTDTL